MCAILNKIALKILLQKLKWISEYYVHCKITKVSHININMVFTFLLWSIYQFFCILVTDSWRHVSLFQFEKSIMFCVYFFILLWFWIYRTYFYLLIAHLWIFFQGCSIYLKTIGEHLNSLTLSSGCTFWMGFLLANWVKH